jgi:anti-sigma factor RsiW
MRWSHVDRELAAYADRSLDSKAASRVAAHLLRCARCKAAFDETRRGAAWMARVQRAEAPIGVDAVLVRSVARPPRSTVPRAWALVPALGALLAGFVLRPSHPSVHLGRGEATELEQAAKEAHLDSIAGRRAFDLDTEAAAAVDAWVLAETGSRQGFLSAKDGRVVFRGAERLAGGRVLVRYDVDRHPVSLLIASAPRAESPSKKRISFRSDKEGLKSLSWSSGGRSYVLTSDLPGLGGAACLGCHAGSAEASEIEALSLES